MANRLSIVIPTYNRKERLLLQLHSIYAQEESSEVDIVICDNNSDYNVLDAVSNEFGKERIKNLRVFVNWTNIGMHANLALIFTHCNTDWMWSMSDDDEALPGSIRMIIDRIDKHPDTLMFKYGIAEYPTYVDYEASSVESIVDFYHNRYPSGHLVFLSNNVYNMNAVRKYYSMTLSYCYCAVAQLLPIFYALENREGVVRFYNDSVVNYKLPAPGTGWNYLNTALAFSSFVLIPFKISNEYYRKLGEVVMSGFSHKRIVYLCLSNEDRGRGWFIYNHIYNVAYRNFGVIKHKMLKTVFICCFLFHIPVPESWNN